MAVRAIGSSEGSTRSGVHWIVCAAVVGLVAVLIAATSGSLQIVTTSRGRVALRTLHGSVQAGEWEARVVVVEGGVGPRNHIVTSLTALRERRGDVIRDAATERLRAGPIGRVAGVAGSAGQIVVVAGVALVAVRDFAGRRQLVAPSQGPTRRSVTPGSSCERSRGRMAVGA